MLGRPWDVDGIVVHGAKRGRAIGVPTANITPEVELTIAPGIYAVTLGVEGGPAMPAVASLGTNPTFVDAGRLVLTLQVRSDETSGFVRPVVRTPNASNEEDRMEVWAAKTRFEHN